MKWEELSPLERAKIIKLGLDSGVSSIQDIRDTYHIYAEGGSKEELSEDAKRILAIAQKNKNSLDRKYDFIVNAWETEFNSAPKGYDPKTGLYYPYPSPEGGTKTVGPGLKLRKDGHGDQYSFTESEAKNGVTAKQINEKLGNNAELQYNKVLEFLNQKGNRLPVDTISPSIMEGLMDLRYQVGALGSFGKLREAVLSGNLSGIKKESKVTYEKNGRTIPDTRRNEERNKRFWHYALGGALYNSSSPIESFRGRQTLLPTVRY